MNFNLNILEKYLIGTVLRSLLITLSFLMMLLLFVSLVDELDDVGKGLYQMSDAFIVSFARLPRFAYESFPLATLVGTLFGLGSLANNSELVAMRAAGFSIRSLNVALFKLGVIVFVAVVLVGEVISPVTGQFMREYRNEKQKEHVTLKTKYGFWAKDDNAYINIRKILPGGRLEDIYIYEFSEEGDLYLASYADSATYNNDSWLLKNIKQTEILQGRTVYRHLKQATWNSILDPDVLSVILVKPSLLPVWELYQYINYIEENGQSGIDYLVAFWSKIASPFACMMMIFLAVPFVLQDTRSVSNNHRVLIGGGLGVVFVFLTKASSYVSIVYEFSPFFMVLMPTMLFSIIAFVFYRRLF